MADAGQDRLYIVGGHDCSYSRAEVYYYQVSSNQWHHHSNMPWSGRHDNAAGIITQKTGERWIVVGKGSEHGHIIYWNIDTNSGWHHVTNLYGNYPHRFMHIVSLTPYTAFMLGGWTERDSFDIQNFWVWSPESYK